MSHNILKTVIGRDGKNRYYVDQCVQRMDAKHFKEIQALTYQVLATGAFYEDDGTVLGGQTRGICRKLMHNIFQPHGDMVQVAFVRFPKNIRPGCQGCIVGKAKTPVTCRGTIRKKGGKRIECDCEEGQFVTRIIAKQTKGNEHPTMRLNQIVCPLLCENNMWLFVCTRIKRSRRGGVPQQLKYEGDETPTLKEECTRLPSPSSCCTCSCPPAPSSAGPPFSPSASSAPPSPSSSTQDSITPHLNNWAQERDTPPPVEPIRQEVYCSTGYLPVPDPSTHGCVFQGQTPSFPQLGFATMKKEEEEEVTKGHFADIPIPEAELGMEHDCDGMDGIDMLNELELEELPPCL